MIPLPVPLGRPGQGEVDRNGGLADAALAGGHRDHVAYALERRKAALDGMGQDVRFELHGQRDIQARGQHMPRQSGRQFRPVTPDRKPEDEPDPEPAPGKGLERTDGSGFAQGLAQVGVSVALEGGAKLGQAGIVGHAADSSPVAGPPSGRCAAVAPATVA